MGEQQNSLLHQVEPKKSLHEAKIGIEHLLVAKVTCDRWQLAVEYHISFHRY